MEPYFEIMKELDIKPKLMLLSIESEETKSPQNETLISMVKTSGAKVNESYQQVNLTEINSPADFRSRSSDL